MNLSKQMMNKQANMALLRQILAPAMKQLQTGAAKTMSGLKTYGKRLTGYDTAKPMANRIRLIKDMERDLWRNIPNPENVAVNSMRYNPRAVGNPTQAVADARRARNTGFEAYKDLNRQGSGAYDSLSKELEAIRKTRLYTGGAASGATLAGVGASAYNNSNNQPMLAKKSMTMPQPSSRGQTKKVQMPEASATKPGCNPEGVQMNNNKQAFMGIGGLAGMATAPEGEEDLSIGRGALRGAGTAIGGAAGAGLGAIGGAGIGSIGGGLLGALSAALSKRRDGQTFGQAVGGGAAGGAMAGGGLGYLAGIPAGAIYGGIKGNKATKALLDKSAPIGEKKKKEDNKEDDKEVKEAAAVVLAQLKRNYNK